MGDRGGVYKVCRTAGALDLEDALLGAAVLEGIQERGLDGEQGPVSIGGRIG